MQNSCDQKSSISPDSKQHNVAAAEVSNPESAAASADAHERAAVRIIPEGEITQGKHLGEGGFSFVVEGCYKGNRVAVKVSKTRSYADESIKNEAEIMAQLSHPNIITFFGLIDVTPTKIVLEYMQQSLLTVLSEGKHPFDKLIIMAIGVAKALAYLHERFYLHRDVTVDNVLINGEVAKLADFGLAIGYERDGTKWDDKKVGLLPVRAPELFDTHEKSGKIMVCYSPGSDIYAFSMMLLELYSKKQPYFDVKWNIMVQHLIVSGKKPQIDENCPRKYAELIRWCWNKDPKQRPSALQVVESLEEQVGGQNQAPEGADTVSRPAEGPSQ